MQKITKNPKVSIVSTTYNQEAYIEQAIKSFLMQETDFIYEVLISDDCSTDGTAEIIERYARKYPDIIKLVLRKKNVGVQRNMNEALCLAKGQYIALCEGDDYWTDKSKLQQQVDFLDQQPQYALCFHPVKVVFEGGEEADAVFPKESSGFTAGKLLDHNFIQTNSVMYRRQKYEQLPDDILPLDWYLHLYHAKFGKIGFINSVMSAYRRHAGGIWWSQRDNPGQIWEKYGYHYLRLLHEIMLLYGDDNGNRKIINDHIAGSYEAIASVKPEGVTDGIAIKSISGMPLEAWDYIKRLMQQVDHYSKHDAYLQGVVDRETLSREQKEQEVKRLSGELNSITSSKSWKALQVAQLGKHSARHPIKGAKRVVNHVHARARRTKKRV